MQSKKTYGTNSSHFKTSPSRRSASSTRLPTVKVAPLNSINRSERSRCTTKLTRCDSSSTAVTSPKSVSGIPPFVSTVSFKTVLDFFQIPNLTNASLDEAIFLHVLYGSLATQARMLAAILPGSLERPLRALLAAMNEPAEVIPSEVQSASRSRVRLRCGGGSTTS
jgi:hypothetical protein